MRCYPMVVSADVRASVRVGFTAFGGGTDEEGRDHCLGTECPKTWGGIVAPTSGFLDLLRSVGKLLLRERLRGNTGTDEEMASASWNRGLDRARC